MTTMRLTFLAAALALLTACAGGGTGTRPASGDAPAAPAGSASAVPAGDAPTASAAGSLEARAKQRWDLLVAGRFAEAYDFLSPGYRAVNPREEYAAGLMGRPVRWLSAEVKEKSCPEGEAYCDIHVDVQYEVQSTLPGVGSLKSVGPLQERWIEIDGSWYFVPKEVTRNDRGLR